MVIPYKPNRCTTDENEVPPEAGLFHFETILCIALSIIRLSNHTPF